MYVPARTLQRGLEGEACCWGEGAEPSSPAWPERQGHVRLRDRSVAGLLQSDGSGPTSPAGAGASGPSSPAAAKASGPSSLGRRRRRLRGQSVRGHLSSFLSPVLFPFSCPFACSLSCNESEGPSARRAEQSSSPAWPERQGHVVGPDLSVQHKNPSSVQSHLRVPTLFFSVVHVLVRLAGGPWEGVGGS